MARKKGLDNRSHRSQISIRFDNENEEWLRLNAIINRQSIADIVNNIIASQRKANPISILRSKA